MKIVKQKPIVQSINAVLYELIIFYAPNCKQDQFSFICLFVFRIFRKGWK